MTHSEIFPLQIWVKTLVILKKNLSIFFIFEHLSVHNRDGMKSHFEKNNRDFKLNLTFPYFPFFFKLSESDKNSIWENFLILDPQIVGIFICYFYLKIIFTNGMILMFSCSFRRILLGMHKCSQRSHQFVTKNDVFAKKQK